MVCLPSDKDGETCEKHCKLNQCFLCMCACDLQCPVFIESKAKPCCPCMFYFGSGRELMGVMGVFVKIEMDLELFPGEIRPYGSEWELWECPGALGKAGRGGDGRQGFQTDTEVILCAMLGGKAVGVLRGLMG